MGILARSVVVALLVAAAARVGTDPSRLRAPLFRSGRRAVEFAAAYPVLSGLLVAGSVVVVTVPVGTAVVAYVRRQT